MTRRLNDLYDQIYKAEDLLQESLMKKATLESEQMSVQSMIGILSSFDAIYDRMNAAERRDLVKYLISEVELFPREEQKTQKRFVKAIAYKFPIEQKVLTQFDECGASVETVVLLSHKKPDGHINVKVEFGEGEGKVPLDNIAKRAESYKPKERVTYKMIKEYIEAKYGFKVHTAYIAEVKRDLGLPMYDAPNAVEELKQPRKHPTVEKVEAIKDALKHFEVI